MKDGYSIIIPYRNRENHLKVLLPKLKEIFKNKEYEIIVSVQDDDNPFSISKVYTVGVNNSQYDKLIFHQVDYIPTENVNYEISNNSCILPCKRGIFLDRDNRKPRQKDDIPGGYKNWNVEIDKNFFGGVLCITRENYNKVNGFNVMIDGWGNEDEDFRERLNYHNVIWERNNEGIFFCLYHQDNGDFENVNKKEKEAFMNGRKLYSNFKEYIHIGHNNLTYKEKITIYDDVKYIQSNNYKVVT